MKAIAHCEACFARFSMELPHRSYQMICPRCRKILGYVAIAGVVGALLVAFIVK